MTRLEELGREIAVWYRVAAMVDEVRHAEREARMVAGPVVVRCLGLVGRVEHVTCDGKTPAGEYLKSYDPEAHDGRGEVIYTTDIRKARIFDTIEAAWKFIGTRPQKRPTRPDGKPNRPLMAFTLQIVPVEPAEPPPG